VDRVPPKAPVPSPTPSPWLQSSVLCSCTSPNSPTLCSPTPSTLSLWALWTLAWDLWENHTTAQLVLYSTPPAFSGDLWWSLTPLEPPQVKSPLVVLWFIMSNGGVDWLFQYPYCWILDISLMRFGIQWHIQWLSGCALSSAWPNCQINTTLKVTWISSRNQDVRYFISKFTNMPIVLKLAC